MQEVFCQFKFPDPVLEFDESFPTDASGKALRKQVEKSFDEASVDLDDQFCRGSVTVRDFFSVLVGVFHMVRANRDRPGISAPCIQFIREASEVADHWYEATFRLFGQQLHKAVVAPLVASSNLDRKLYWMKIRQIEGYHGKLQVRMTASSSEAKNRRIVIDGEPPPMLPVPRLLEGTGVGWLSWEAPIPGEAPKGHDYPVYVQSHALRRLRERANLPPLTPYLECWLYESLKAPLVVERQGENLLIEFRVQEARIGYLVVTPFEQPGGMRGVVVRTFVFLTMENTPEARQLRKQLRLGRRDGEWLGLSDLNAFTQTDLRNDPVLRPLLESCGCGHLFEFGQEENGEFAPQPRALAAVVRRYLRMAA
jgi:hypothetical protein